MATLESRGEASRIHRPAQYEVSMVARKPWPPESKMYADGRDGPSFSESHKRVSTDCLDNATLSQRSLSTKPQRPHERRQQLQP